jgi:ABC-type sugar transport system ATPase subunit
MVFQNYALYPHMTVRRNLAYGLRVRKTPKADLDARVDAVARLLGLEDLLDRKPGALSGGQRQRVAFFDQDTGESLCRSAEVAAAHAA